MRGKKATAASKEPNSAPEALLQNKHFAAGVNFYKLVWVFIIGCVLGFVIEEAWCLLTKHVWESRKGLIYGPFSQVYGFGAVLMTLALHWLAKYRDIIVFAGSALIGGAFEFICSVVQEYVFGTVSWDYSDRPFHLGGRTNLLYMFFWGVLGLLFIKEIYPRMSRLIERIPNKWGVAVTWVLIIFLAFDMFISSVAVARQSARRAGRPARNGFEEFLDNTYTDDYLHKIYPNMIVVE